MGSSRGPKDRSSPVSSSIAKLDRRLQPYARALVEVARDYGLNPRITSTYRSLAEQKRLYARYLQGRHPLPVAVPGKSLHNYGLAIDLVSSDNAWLGKVWSYWGGRWGGARDPVHFGAY